MPPLRLGLGDPTQALPGNSKPPFDDGGLKASREQHLERGGDAELVLPNEILGRRSREPDRLAHDHEEFQGDAVLSAQVLEGRVGEARISVVQGEIEEVEGEIPLLQDLRHGLKGQAGPLESIHDSSSSDIARRERSIVGRLEDAEVHKRSDLLGADPRLNGHLAPQNPAHITQCSDSPMWGALRSRVPSRPPGELLERSGNAIAARRRLGDVPEGARCDSTGTATVADEHVAPGFDSLVDHVTSDSSFRR
jgi:hypothetical protein